MVRVVKGGLSRLFVAYFSVSSLPLPYLMIRSLCIYTRVTVQDDQILILYLSCPIHRCETIDNRMME